MGVFSRLGDIFNSNINAILDKAEDPEKIIRMVIQEMEDTLIEVRSSAAKVIADQKDVARQLTKLEEAAAEWARKAELAVSKGREDLARGALTEKRNVTDMIESTHEEMDRLADALARHEADVEKLDAKLREARAKKATMQARHKTASNQVRVRKNLYDNRISDAFDRFEQVERRIDRLEGEAEAMALGRGDGTDDLEDAFKALEGDDEIERELAELTAKAGKSDTTPKVVEAKPAPKKKAAK